MIGALWIRDERRWRACAFITASLAIAYFAIRLLDRHLWFDELCTATLLTAKSLTSLWSGILQGLDGNPPLYLTTAWLIAHILPPFVSRIVVLKLLNIGFAIFATVLFCRLSRRTGSWRAILIGACMFAALNDNLLQIAIELRHYAMYFVLAAGCMLLQQRQIEQRRPVEAVILTLLNVALAMVHTFGIIYVLCIATAGWLSQPTETRHRWMPIGLTILPAMVVFALWLPFLRQEAAIFQPYTWIPVPTVWDLVRGLFASQQLTWLGITQLYGIAALTLWLSRQRSAPAWREVALEPAWQPYRYTALLISAFSSFVLVAWIFSLVRFPLFVPRYFTPQLYFAFMLGVAVCEMGFRAAQAHAPERRRRFARLATVLAPLVLSAILLGRIPVRDRLFCSDGYGGFFESSFVNGDLPVIADSAQIWFPRFTYASYGQLYLFPLDWDVVLKYPTRDSGNASDYHTMDAARRWAGIANITTTDDVLKSYQQFLVIESDHAWLENLRQTRDVTAERLTSLTGPDGDDVCKLWKVTRVQPRP